MVFTLGITAHAASAHRYPDQPAINRPSHTTPTKLLAHQFAPSNAIRPLQTVMYVDASTPPASYPADDTPLSRSSSTRSTISTSDKASKKRKAPRSRTCYSLAHPAPTGVKQKLSIRPKLLLQMQRISDSSRPVPTYDVLPSTIFAPRLARKFPKVFRGKDGLGANDLVVVSSEEYTRTTALDPVSEELEDEGWNSRDVLASICQLRRNEGRQQGKAEICLNDGARWEASPLPNGSYEFVSVDEHGITTTARWVIRSPSAKQHKRHASLSTPNPSCEETGDRSFNFSIVNPSFRRHPILATLSRNKLEILDAYSSPTPSSSIHPPTSPSAERTLTTTSPALHTLIAITSLWVSLRESWSPTFSYDDGALASPTFCPTSPNPSSPTTHRTLSLPLTLSTHSSSSRTASPDHYCPGTKASKLLHRGVSHLTPPTSPTECPTSTATTTTTTTTTTASATAAVRARRANSTGTAFMARRASSGWRSGTVSLEPAPTRLPSAVLAANITPPLAPLRDVSGEKDEGSKGDSQSPVVTESARRERPTSWAPPPQPPTSARQVSYGKEGKARPQSEFLDGAGVGAYMYGQGKGAGAGKKKLGGRLRGLLGALKRGHGVAAS